MYGVQYLLSLSAGKLSPMAMVCDVIHMGACHLKMGEIQVSTE
jgi:hypothetical protein